MPVVSDTSPLLGLSAIGYLELLKDQFADFVYDADGRRVKSVMGSETILFFGPHYEVKNPGSGQTVTKLPESHNF